MLKDGKAYRIFLPFPAPESVEYINVTGPRKHKNVHVSGAGICLFCLVSSCRETGFCEISFRCAKPVFVAVFLVRDLRDTGHRRLEAHGPAAAPHVAPALVAAERIALGQDAKV